MNNPFLAGRRVRVLGERLIPLASEALPGVIFEADLAAPCDLVLIDADASPAQAMAAIDALARQPLPPAALLVGAQLPTGLVKALIKLDRSDVLETPFGPADLALAAAALMAHAAPAAPPPPPPDSHCWAFIGTVGGCGATTLAIETAAILAQRSKGRRKVCLVDLNLADGAAGAYLGAAANMRLAEASAAPDRIDATVLAAFAAQVEDDFHLLAAPRDPRAFGTVSPETVIRVLELACQTYDWVIVDMPRTRHGWTLDVLAGADEVVLVSELTVPALLSARAMAGEIEADLPDSPSPRIVLNRMNKKMFGPAPSLGEAERALQRKADGSIASDWEAASTSVNLGGPVCHHRPRSKLVKDVEAFVDRLVEAQVQRAEPAESRSHPAVRAA